MKIVVFDLDETLGYFTELGIFWDSLKIYLKNKNKNGLTQNDFNDILDLYPQFLRPNIINILLYLKKKKYTFCCHKMMIYTNNNGPQEWANHIIDYFENKINFKLIDQIIAAFKVNGNKVEICRTTQNKTHTDFIKCTKLPNNAEICFVDDTFYPEMKNENIYYINIKPYYYDLEIDYMLNTFIKSDIGRKLIGTNDENNDFYKIMTSTINLYKYKYVSKNEKEYEIDKSIGKQLILHLEEFFTPFHIKDNAKKNIKTMKRINQQFLSSKNKTYKNMFMKKNMK